MSVAVQCVISWGVGVVAGVTLTIVFMAVTGWRVIRVKRAEAVVQVTLFPGDLALVKTDRIREFTVR